MKKVFVVVLFLVLFVVMAVPAGATPGEAISFTLHSEYTYWPAYDVEGTWTSSGFINSSGQLLDVPKHFGSGSPKGKPFQTAHVIEVIGDEHGTITISTQLKEFEFKAWLPCGEGQFCQHYDGFGGNWVILSGTGDYANLHGQGTLSSEGVKGDAYLVWDESAERYRFEGQDIVGTYEGTAHFDPQ